MEKNETPDDDARHFVQSTLEESSEYRKKVADKDFGRLQIFCWAALATSSVSSIAIAMGITTENNLARFVFAVVAAVPGFIVAVESGMNYARRHKMNEDAHLQYQLFLFELKAGGDPKEIYDRYIRYARAFTKDFPSGSVIPPLLRPTKSDGKLQNSAESDDEPKK